MRYDASYNALRSAARTWLDGISGDAPAHFAELEPRRLQLDQELDKWGAPAHRSTIIQYCQAHQLTNSRLYWASDITSKDFPLLKLFAIRAVLNPIHSCDVERVFSRFSRLTRNRQRISRMNRDTVRYELFVQNTNGYSQYLRDKI